MADNTQVADQEDEEIQLPPYQQTAEELPPSIAGAIGLPTGSIAGPPIISAPAANTLSKPSGPKPAPSITGAPPLDVAPDGSITGQPPLAPAKLPDSLAKGPDLAADTAAGKVAAPNWADYKPAHVGLGRKIGAALLGGMAGIKDPTLGTEVTRSVLDGPELSKFGADTSEFGSALAQGNRQQKTADDEARRGLETAQTAHLQKETEDSDQPKPKEEDWSVVAGIQGPNGEPVQQEKNSGQIRLAPISGVQAKTPTKDQPLESQYDEAVKAGDTARANQIKTEMQAMAGAKREPKDETASSNARSDKSFQYNQGALDKIRSPIDALQQRFSRLTDTLNQASPQADALVAPELLSVMAGGVGSGVRMNEAEISRIVGGRSKWQDLQAAIQKWSTDPKAARSITKEQDEQIRSLIGTVGQKITAKQRAIEEAQDKLLDTDDPKEHRRIVAGTRKSLDDIDSGESSGSEGGKTYTDSEVQAAAKAHGMTPEQVEKAYKDKGYKKAGQ